MKGILFKPDMIKAVTRGINPKTVTRRAIKFKPFSNIIDSDWHAPWLDRDTNEWVFAARFGLAARGQRVKPRYRVGETVYIKEAWWTPPDNKIETHNQNIVSYRAIIVANAGEEAAQKNRWLSPLFMPAWAARYFLKIIDVRAERLQEIENEPNGFVKEGYIPLMLGKSAIDGKPFEASLDFAWYENLWDIINGEGDYALNKWVWRYEFILTPHKGGGEKD